MNFAAFTFLAMPRGYIAALLALVFLAQARAFATDGQKPVVALRSCTAVATSIHTQAREGEVKSSAAVMTAECVCSPRRLGVGGAGDHPTTLPGACSSAGRTLVPTAQLAEASMKVISGLRNARRISAALHNDKTAGAVGHTAAPAHIFTRGSHV